MKCGESFEERVRRIVREVVQERSERVDRLEMAVFSEGYLNDRVNKLEATVAGEAAGVVAAHLGELTERVDAIEEVVDALAPRTTKPEPPEYRVGDCVRVHNADGEEEGVVYRVSASGEGEAGPAYQVITARGYGQWYPGEGIICRLVPEGAA